jgi:hypothetical protein
MERRDAKKDNNDTKEREKGLSVPHKPGTKSVPGPKLTLSSIQLFKTNPILCGTFVYSR